MDYIKVFFSAVFSIAALFVSTKIIGNKQLSQLNLFDYINGITIGSIAAEMATDTDREIILHLIAIFIYTAAVYMFDLISRKSHKASEALNGRGVMLFENDKLSKENLKSAHLELSDFLAACHLNGFFSIEEIDCAVLEQNGEISIKPKEMYRPVNLSDMNIKAMHKSADIVVISDGEILSENLKQSGNNEAWIENELRRQKIGSVKDVFLGVCNSENMLICFKCTDSTPKNDKIQ